MPTTIAPSTVQIGGNDLKADGQSSLYAFPPGTNLEAVKQAVANDSRDQVVFSVGVGENLRYYALEAEQLDVKGFTKYIDVGQSIQVGALKGTVVHFDDEASNTSKAIQAGAEIAGGGIVAGIGVAASATGVGVVAIGGGAALVLKGCFDMHDIKSPSSDNPLLNALEAPPPSGPSLRKP